jgi:hypothetical protein
LKSLVILWTTELYGLKFENLIVSAIVFELVLL